MTAKLFTMSLLLIVFSFKILVTAAFLVPGFLILPKARMEKMLTVEVTSILLFRLYGFAMAALLVAYITGALAVVDETFPWGIVVMGIVSNLGAAITLFTLGRSRLNFLSGLLFGAIGIGFLVCALLPDLAMAKFV